MSKAQLIEIAKQDLAYGRAGTQDLADDILQIPVEAYYDRDRWRQEMKLIFGRLPLVLATSAELKEPGDYKAMTAAGMQVLITRNQAGEVNAFVNMCSHRGAKLMAGLWQCASLYLPLPCLEFLT